ncbi:tetratricopeptide repeat protein [Labedella endophytica]|uniref:Uncharacterized protein n=1 Tax=Labedella endophytica TaxID=1523160 RepID=A0A3S0VE55_9MICO|nr:hypothetical protein [Labedella endophytica]RUQ98237.1 hypothetical protein ELQ94_14585 [Labedella endophytica]
MSEHVQGVVYRAESFLSVGQVDRAETLLRTELAQRPDDGALLLSLAKVSEARRRWPEVVTTATAALEANPNSLQARLMIAWAAYQVGDRPLMKQHLDVVLHYQPEQPTALMYLALHASVDKSTAGKERTRAIVRQSLALGGGDPWYTVLAAKIEVFTGRPAEARRLVDDGLAQDPTNTQLLTLKSELARDPDESIDIVSGLLATSPADLALRMRFESLVTTRRRAMLVMLWLGPALAALGTALVTDYRIGWMVGVAAASFSVWATQYKSYQALPPGYRAELDSKAPWRVATRWGGRTAAIFGVFGGVLLATGLAPAAWALVVATFGWVVTRIATFSRERAVATSADAEHDLLSEGGPAAPGLDQGAPKPLGRYTLALSRNRWARATTTPLLLIPFCIVGLIPPDAPDESSTARAALGVIAGIVGLVCLVEASFWTRVPGNQAATAWRAFRLVVPGILLTIMLLCGVAFLTVATASWASGQPAPTIGDDSDPAPATIPPDYFDDLNSPPPTIDIPDFDIPSIPPLDIPPTAPEG